MWKAKRRWLERLRALPQQILNLLKGKMGNVAYSLEEAPAAGVLHPLPAGVNLIKQQTDSLLRRPPRGIAPLPAAEQYLVERLREEAARLNRNNVTRTAAYLDIYRQHPELHWAFLAHMVSRNGGWTMTDLKGELLPCLLGAGQRESLFRFLERANGLIFYDAYPQLLLYRESTRTGRRLTHLLPHLGVTEFMIAVWDEFHRTRDSALLTCCLIVNEQHFIEERIVQSAYFKEHVLDTLAFKTQSLLQMNQVLFPYAGPEGGNRLRLAGLILENFADLSERIRFGQSLYAILFAQPDVYRGAHHFAVSTPHTGSRADYWPELFAEVRHSAPNPVYRPRLNGSCLAAGAEPLFSPRLAHAWKDRPVEPPEPGDWCRGQVGRNALKLLPSRLHVPFDFDMSQEYPYALNKIELAIMAAQELGTKA
ncbi:DUF2515 family protein [Paenibacillus chartarius]|uniref:DUF2515 family protein n=1 Tax=Paenibacillus chartarius TaxID=747481 RepID=A0ABV6DFE6_9BACL